jgi:hypothetical protein
MQTRAHFAPRIHRWTMTASSDTRGQPPEGARGAVRFEYCVAEVVTGAAHGERNRALAAIATTSIKPGAVNAGGPALGTLR